MRLLGKRIFLIEDNMYNRLITQTLVEQAGAIIEFEEWGKDTREKLAAFAPVDIVILDLMLPEPFNGFDVFDEIRGMPELENVPIVAVSAKPPDTAIPETQAKGFDGFISKPIDFLIFTRQIESLINGEAVWYSR